MQKQLAGLKTEWCYDSSTVKLHKEVSCSVFTRVGFAHHQLYAMVHWCRVTADLYSSSRVSSALHAACSQALQSMSAAKAGRLTATVNLKTKLGISAHDFHRDAMIPSDAHKPWDHDTQQSATLSHTSECKMAEKHENIDTTGVATPNHIHNDDHDCMMSWNDSKQDGTANSFLQLQLKATL